MHKVKSFLTRNRKYIIGVVVIAGLTYLYVRYKQKPTTETLMIFKEIAPGEDALAIVQKIFPTAFIKSVTKHQVGIAIEGVKNSGALLLR